MKNFKSIKKSFHQEPKIVHHPVSGHMNTITVQNMFAIKYFTSRENHVCDELVIFWVGDVCEIMDQNWFVAF